MFKQHKERIELTDSLVDMIHKLAEGNIGAVTVLSRILTEGKDIDPDAGFGQPVFLLLNIDSCGIYAEKIWMLYKDVCGQNLSKMLACLRAWQLGFITQESLHNAINNRGAGIDLADICTKVSTELPNFKLS